MIKGANIGRLDGKYECAQESMTLVYSRNRKSGMSGAQTARGKPDMRWD